MNRNPLVQYLAILSLLLIMISCQLFQSASITVSGLKTEYVTDPLGVDVTTPRFSWVLKSSYRGVSQSAYQLKVAKSRDQLAEDANLLWDTGKMNSSETVNIEYEGNRLESGEKYFWRVKVWDQQGNQSQWSHIATWQMGLLNPSDWKAKWITTADTTVSAPLFRNEFDLSKPVASAYAYVTGVGYYEFYLNGQKVGDHVLDPAITHYQTRTLYETYDITDILDEGDNAAGLWLGNSGFRVQQTEGRWAWSGSYHNYGTPRGIVQILVNFEDGSSTWIMTDKDWKTSPSPITYNNVYGGENYDARREQAGWNKTGFDDSDWEGVQLVDTPTRLLDSQLMPPIRVTQTIRPVKRTHPDSNTWLFDLGQNIPGWWQVRVKGDRGTQIKVRSAETLNDSLYPTPLKPGDSLSTHKEYHRNVWTTYTLNGEGTETYEPRFFYTGYRYMEVTVDKPDQLESFEIAGRVVHSDLERNGHFSSSDTLLNQIYDAAIWSQYGNQHGYPTDCPHREKGGYTGDGQVIAETSIHDFQMNAFYRNWLNDMRDSQQENGRIPNTAPTVLGGHGGGIAWGSAYILVPWWMNSYYGDQSVLEEHYSSMKDYIGYLHNLARTDSVSSEKYIINEFGGYWDSLGEWEAPVRDRTGPINPLTNTYYWYLDTITIAKIAGELGNDQDRAKYEALADTIKKAFNEKFFLKEDNLYGTPKPYQSYLLFALSGDLVPQDHRQAVLDSLIHDIEVTSNGHLGTGILGTKHLFKVLVEEGKEDVVHQVVTKKTFPSWGNWIKNGATTLWESWNAKSSHNHQMFGTVNEYFYKYLAGIRPPMDEHSAPGYKKVHIKPYVPKDMQHAKASIQTMHGKLSSAWKQQYGQLQLDVVIPANTTGTVSIPIGDSNGGQITISENGNTVWENGKFTRVIQGIEGGKSDGEYISFRVGSGSYSFRLKGN